jgi:DNA-binding PadR family transcriptional regulator
MFDRNNRSSPPDPPPPDRTSSHARSGQRQPGWQVQRQAQFSGAIDSSTVYTPDMTKRTMQEATFLILTALAAGSQHGYGIITDVAQISDGRVRLRAGTLYSALDRLRLDGLIEVDREEIVEGRLRRYYRLTPQGARQLATEAARFQSNVAAALARLGLAGGMATR